MGTLGLKIQTFIGERDNVFTEGRSTELAQLIISTDSSGVIREIRSMAIDTDSLYKIFKKMTPGYFSDWKGPKNKTILIPFFYFSSDPGRKRNYVDTIFLDYYKRIPAYVVMAEYENTIIVKWMMAATPVKARNEY